MAAADTIGFFVKVVEGTWRLGRTGQIIGAGDGEFLVSFGVADSHKQDTAWYSAHELALIGIQL